MIQAISSTAPWPTPEATGGPSRGAGEPRGITWLTVVREGEQGVLRELADHLGWAERPAVGGEAAAGSDAALGDGHRILAGLAQEWILIDLTRAGHLSWPGARVLRPASRSAQQGLAEAAAAADFEHLLLAPVWSAPAPGRAQQCQRAWQAEPQLPLVFGGLAVTHDQHERLHDPSLWAGLPPAGFEATLGVQRARLLELDPCHGMPVELTLWQRHAPAGRNLGTPLARISAAVQEQQSARLRWDAELLAAWQLPANKELEFSVLLATHQRVELLLECLDGFARQPLRRGSFEIVVVNDGSRDGTREVLEALRLPVPFTHRSVAAGGAAAARRVGMPLCRGERILFVNDDTLPFVDTLRSHLEAHQAYAPRQVSILGTFEQPPQHLRRLLMAYLEHSNHVFGYPDFQPGQVLPGRHYYTCNASTPRAAIEAIGGFDGQFAMLAEDTDLGIRLEQAGIPLIYRPEVRALHQHLLSYADIRRRQPTVARAHARLVRKHPWLLQEFEGWRKLELLGLRSYLARAGQAQGRCEALLKTLADLDVAAIRELSPEDADLATALEVEFSALFPRISGLWWSEGFVEGFEQLHMTGFSELWESLSNGAQTCTTA
jgi:GT2 family glycosyltransferase